MMKLRKNKALKRLLIVLSVAFVATGIVVSIHNHSIHKAQNKSGKVPTSKKVSTKDSGSKASSQTASSNKPTSASDKVTSATASTSGPLITPFGSFVSNHRPGQDGSPTTEQSVCNTTPGAICDIQFTNAGVTKSLGAQTADRNGTAYWSWDVDGATLAPGSWHVTAVVKLNGQTKSASDPALLEVQ